MKKDFDEKYNKNMQEVAENLLKGKTDYVVRVDKYGLVEMIKREDLCSAE